jgi:hypothetical protein
VSCQHGTATCRAVPPCQTMLWARPSAHDMAHGSFTRAVPPVPPMGHGAHVRAWHAAMEGEGARRAARATGRAGSSIPTWPHAAAQIRSRMGSPRAEVGGDGRNRRCRRPAA